MVVRCRSYALKMQVLWSKDKEPVPNDAILWVGKP